MKKNILAIVILAATLVNLTLSAMILFTFVPYVKKADSLITNILKVIDLEIESGAGRDDRDVDVADLENVSLLTDAMISLKKGANDTKTHYAANISASISVNTKHDDYATKKPLIDAQSDVIKDIILTEISKYTYDQLNENYTEIKSDIEKAVLEQLQSLFNSKFIYKVTINFIQS